MATWHEDIVAALGQIGGFGTLKQVYDQVQIIRENLPENWEAITRRTLQEHSSDTTIFREGTEDTFFSVEGVGRGIWGLRSSIRKTASANDLNDEENESGGADRISQHVYRIIRDTALARKLKLIHQNKCQICGEVITLLNGQTYAEAHHIQPLGHPHNGPDIAENLVIVCPNHHVLLDYGAMSLEIGQLRMVDGHRMGNRYLDYHNARVEKSRLP